MSGIETKAISLGREKYSIAPLTFRQLDECKPELDVILAAGGNNFADPGTRAAVLKIVAVSVTSAGMALSEDDLLDKLTTANFSEIIRQIFDRNGFLAKSDDDPGEAAAAASPT